MRLSAFDHHMIQVAKARGPVVVHHGERVRLAQLVAWRPSRNGKHTKKARVQYPAGTYATVPITDITIPEEK